MKKILLFLSFLLMSIGAWGATETITLSDFGWSNASAQSSISSSVSTIVLAKNSAGTAPTYYTSDGLRIYGVKNGATTGGTISFTPKTGITISKIEFTHTSSNSGILAIKSGTGSYTNKTWTGTLTAGNTVVLVSKNNKDSNPQVRITQIVITYTSTASYTITALSNNTDYGTVSLSGSVITGSPKSCCRYASPAYTVTSGTATVSQNGNEFTVTPSSNCTVQINFEARPKYTISFNNAAGTNPPSIQQSTCDESITLPTSAQISDACSEMGWTFAGWTTKSNGELSSSDLVGSSFTPTKDTTLYAVFKKIEGRSGESAYVIFQAPGGGDSSTERTSDSDIKNEVVDEYDGISTFSGSKLYDGGSGAKLGSNSYSGRITMNLSSPITTNQITVEASQYSSDGGYLHVEVNGSTSFGSDILPSTGTCVFTNATNVEITSVTISTTTKRAYLQSVTIGEGGTTDYSFNPVCETVHVDTVTLPVDTIRIRINDTYELTPTVLPSNATNKNVSWVSTMPGIATVVDGVVTGVSEGTAAAIIVTEDGSKSAACVVIVLGNPNIDIVEWNPDWLKIDIENFTAATATLEDQNTQADVEINYADSLFFSKYFEAASNVKLIGIYNGTNHSIDISDYKFAKATCGESVSSASFTETLFSTFVRSDGKPFNTIIRSCEELILISYHDNDISDSVIIQCAKDNPQSGYADYVRISSPAIDFNGDDAIALVNPDGNFIDLIGAGTKAGGSIKGSDFRSCSKSGASGGDCDGFMDKPGGWFSEDGINVETNDSNYALATNRCLLVRKKRVKSGLDAVAKNTTTFVTLGGTYGEWRGLQMPGGSPNTADGEGTFNSCSGFDDVGTFDYNDYYIDYDTIYEEQTIPGKEEDGFYKIDIENLDALSCTNLKISVKDTSNNVLEEIVKIPIMIKTDATTVDATYFNKKNCDECDVVVLKNKILTVAGTTSANRDMKLYEGAELRVPTSTSYTLNSLALRRENDTVSSLYLNGGTLTVTNKVYFDLYITSEDWHYVSLPGDFSLSNVKFTNGKTPEHRKDYWARHYDGYLRSRNLTGGWQAANIDSTFSAGQGFIFGLDDRYKKKEFRFEFNNSILTSEVSNKTIPNLYSWGCGDESLRPNHKGWNLIGNPYLGFFNAEIYDKIRVDSLVKVMENGHWTGLWELSNDSRAKTLRYAVIPSDAPEDRDAGGYKSVLLDDMKLSPFICFFVQIGGNDESAKAITMSAARRTNKIVARNYQEDEDDELFLRVKVDGWKTGCFISKNFSDKYEPGDDLESRYPIYQSIGGYNLLYSAINDSIIEHGVQVTAPQGTLYLDPKVDVDKFEYIYVNYNDGWFDLLHGETIDIETTTFILSAKRKVKENVTTDNGDLKPTNGIYKFTDGKNIYINKNNTIFNIIGSKIR